MLRRCNLQKLGWLIIITVTLSVAACTPTVEEERLTATDARVVEATQGPQATSTSFPTTVVEEEQQLSVFVRIFWFQGDRADIAHIPTIRIHEYGSGPGSYIWLELTPEAFQKLEQSGVEFELVENATVLHLSGYNVDTRAGEPEIPSEWRSMEEAGTSRLYLIQMVGPPQDEWYAQVEASGATILQYYQPHAYLVWITPAQRAEIQNFSFIRWTGLYHPAYKVDSTMLQKARENAGGVIENVSITIYDDDQADGTVDQAIEAIQELGGELVGHGGKRAHDPFVGTVFRLPADSILPVAHMNAVVWVSYRQPVDEFEE